MEYLEGVTLKHRIAGKSLDIETVVSLGTEIADGPDDAPCTGDHPRRFQLPPPIDSRRAEQVSKLPFGLHDLLISFYSMHPIPNPSLTRVRFGLVPHVRTCKNGRS